MAKKKTWKVLWVDDQTDVLNAYAPVLEKEGLQIDRADASLAALELAKQKDYDLILVDISMPKPDGIELLRRLAPIQEHARLVILSSYLHLNTYRSQLAQLDFPFELLDKDFPPLHSTDLKSRFVDPILRLLPKQTEAKQHHAKVDSAATSSPRNPFEMPLADFMVLSTQEKDAITSEAKAIASTTIKRAFNDGQLWIFLCGSATQIRASARSTDAVLSEEAIMAFANAQQRVPFQFFREATVEEGWIPSGEPHSQDFYPTVTLEIASREFVLHFDTGSPMTFFSYETLVEVGALRPTTLFGMAVARSRGFGQAEYFAAPLKITAILKCQSTGQTQIVNLTGQAVRDWDRSPFTSFAQASRPQRKKPAEKQTVLSTRTGLIGRNLLTENGITLCLDGRTRRTSLPA